MNARLLSPAACAWLCAILRERFGHDFELSARPGVTVLSVVGRPGAIQFDTSSTSFSGSARALPCPLWSPAAEGLTAPLGQPLPAPGLTQLVSPLIESGGFGFNVHYDLPGLAHWMLARLEELNSSELDQHGRFPSSASHAVRHGYLERPIVDEWFAVLGELLRRAFPGLVLREPVFSQRVSHDVDSPSRYGFCTPYKLVSAIGGDILRRRDFTSVYRAPILRLGRRNSLNKADPYHTFEWIMDVSERAGLKSAFYFICGRSSKKDAQYEPDHPSIRELMRQIHARGHEIGLHPSYGTFQDPETLAAEAWRLKRICAEEGIEQAEWGGRMHFLRWRTPITLHGWVRGGMNYESSLGYADAPGFRGGTCFEYPAFDPVADAPLALRLRPLVAMECTVVGPRYLALGTGEPAFQRFAQLKAACRAVNGCFTLLWHNSRFTPPERELYQRVLSG